MCCSLLFYHFLFFGSLFLPLKLINHELLEIIMNQLLLLNMKCYKMCCIYHHQSNCLLPWRFLIRCSLLLHLEGLLQLIILNGSQCIYLLQEWVKYIQCIYNVSCDMLLWVHDKVLLHVLAVLACLHCIAVSLFSHYCL